MSSSLSQEATGEQLRRLRWSKLTASTQPRAGTHTNRTATLVGFRVYHTTDAGLLFSLQSHTWRQLGRVLNGISGGHAAELAADKIYYFGRGVGEVLGYDTVLEKAARVKRRGDGPRGIAGMSAVFAPWRSEIVTFGGRGRRHCVNTTYAFNVESKTWKKLEMRGMAPDPRDSPAAAILGTKMFIYGGYGAAGPLGDLWIAELKNSTRSRWSLVRVDGNAPTSRRMPSLYCLGDVLLVFGQKRQGHADKFDTYLPAEGRWLSEELGQVGETDEHQFSLMDSIGVAVSTGIVCFTRVGVYKLSPE